MFHRTVPAVVLSALIAASAQGELTDQIRLVEAVRKVSFKEAVRQKTIPRAELRPYLEEQIRAELPVSLDDHVGALRALRLIGDQPNPIGKLLDLYQSQVVAFYDPQTDLYYSIEGAPPGIDPAMMSEDAVALHELTHALQDQVFGAGEAILKVRDDWDAQMAYHAVLEGEATLVMLGAGLQMMGSSLDAVLTDEMLESFTSMVGQSTAAQAPEGTPEYFVASLTFPYLEGLKFIARTYREGGWDAVDRIHRNPPRSTAELLHPELYGRLKRPADIVPLKSARFGTTLGEFHWKFLFGKEAAAGWAADRVELVKNGKGQWTVLADTRWSSSEEALQFSDAVKARFKDARVSQTGEVVRFAYGADRSRIELFVPRVAARTAH
jgi:hypothetical protein